MSGPPPEAAARRGTAGGRPRAAGPSARQLTNLRLASLGALVMLILEFALGTGVNLYVTLPARDRGSGLGAAIGQALSAGPAAVTAHAALGLLLIVSAVALLIRAIACRHVPVTVAAVVGLLAILAATSSGARFVGTGQDSASLTMALATAVAMLCYAVSLFRLGSGGGTRARRPARPPG